MSPQGQALMPMCGSSFSERTVTRGRWRWKSATSPTSLSASRPTHFVSQTSSAWESSPKYEFGTTTQVRRLDKQSLCVVKSLNWHCHVEKCTHFATHATSKFTITETKINLATITSYIFSLALWRPEGVTPLLTDWPLKVQTSLVSSSFLTSILLTVFFVSWSHYTQALLLDGT